MAPSVAANPGNGRVCLADMDPRQRGLFGAAWTLGYIAAFAEGGAASVAVGAVTGPQGMIYRQADYAQPGLDGGKAAVYPLYHVVAGLARAGGSKRIAAASADPSTIAARGASRQGRSGVVARQSYVHAAQSEDRRIQGCGESFRRSIFRPMRKALADPQFLSKGGKPLKKVGMVELGPYAVLRVAAA